MSRWHISQVRVLFVLWVLFVLVPEIDCVPVLAADPPAQEKRVFQVTGVLRKIEPDGKTAVIAHDEIPGYMEAMTMPFPVKSPKDLEGLKPGDKVTFRMTVTPDEGWIDRVTKVDNVSNQSVSSQGTNAPETTHIARAVEPLEVGDQVPDYHFTNELGQAVSLQQFRGKAVAFTFFFTRCPFPNFCPRLSNNFEEAQRQLLASKNAPQNWHLFSISFDQRDTPQILHHYGAKYDYDPKHWSFLTGAQMDIEALADQVGELFWKEGGSLGHNQRTVVLDTQGRIRRIFIGNEWKVADLIAEMVKATEATPAKK